MKRNTLLFKKIFIGILLVIITALHFTVSSDNTALHLIHREFYFIPILLVSLWFGLNAGFIVSVLISLIYSSFILSYSQDHPGLATAVPQALMFILIGTMTGFLSDKRKKSHRKELENNNIIVLGRAALAVAYEMKDILTALQNMFNKRPDEQRSTEFDKNFEAELSRLSKMVDIMSSYAKKEKSRTFSNDLNKLIKKQIDKFQKDAMEKGVFFQRDLDSNGCPSWIDPNKLSWVIDKLLENAMDVSSSGNKILISSQRNGEYCSVSIQDEGPGITPENIKKIFSPFFTTKPNGQGLALAGCKKSIDNMGGKIFVESTLGEGTKFTIQVPREYRGASLAQDTPESVFRGQSDKQFYRE